MCISLLYHGEPTLAHHRIDLGHPLEHGPQLDMTFMSGSLQELAAQPVVPYMLPDASVALLDGETGVELRHLPAGMAGSAGSFTGHSFPDGVFRFSRKWS